MLLKGQWSLDYAKQRQFVLGVPVWNGELVMSSMFPGFPISGTRIDHQKLFKDKPVL